ncbi:phage minor head protein [Streptomyces prunicolor]|uniref:phage minor head protein n=1 Tax=Streptomyces prunicolor TaxID=67348 RepID=UPI0003810A76|nr:phage minor head protein [Streptomyces prunicolor]
MADVEQQLQAAEQAVAEEVRAVLDEVAAEISRGLGDASEIVAARFSLSRIGRMWTARVPRIMRRLLGIAETAAHQAADDVNSELPDGWEDLPGQHDRGDDLPASLGSYVTDTEHLLRAVGDRLTAAAVAELAAGRDAGEDIDQLRTRLRGLFSRAGAELGETREERIARTESTRAWNASTLAAAQDLTSPDRPLVKQWLTRRDTKVRDTHKDVNGQLRLLDEAFAVGGVAMDYPGDPTAPPQLTVNCRCTLRLAPERRTAAAGTQEASTAGFSNPREVAAAASQHTGAMIALLPTEEDAQRLAVDGGESAEDLHCTLVFLGKGADWNQEQRAALVAAMREYAGTAPVAARAFGAAHWNPHGDEPVWVWNMGDDREDRDPSAPTLHDMHVAALYAVTDAYAELPDIPEQHTPWHAHVTAIYSAAAERFYDLVGRVGPVTFDRVRVAFAGEHFDIPLGPAEEEPPMATPVQAEAETAPPPVRTWSTPDGAALAFENQQTGDGRIFTRGALYWDGAGPWPLQYAEAMGQGHDGAELAGSIQKLGRRGDDITGSGGLYLTQPAGFDAVLLLEQGAPLGVSVDLDDVDVQLVDTTATPGEDEADIPVLAASFASASVMRLDDGTWMISGRERAEWTASGVEMAHSARTTMLFTSPGGTISAATARRVFGNQLTAAAGESDPGEGVVFHEEKSGDFLVRITRARLRGATLVSMPAYDKARIVLDPPGEQTASAPVLVAASGDSHERLVTYVRSSPTPVGPRHLADKLGMALETVHSHLARAIEAGTVVRLARGLYVGASTLPEGEVTAAAFGDSDLPVHDDAEAAWDGSKAASRILAWATDDKGDVDADKLGQGFLYRDDAADPATAGAYKLPFADVFTDGDTQRLEIVADGVYAAADVLEGSMGGVDLPDDDRKAVRSRVETLYQKLAKAFDDDTIQPPWSDEATASAALDALYDERGAQIVASAWQVMHAEQPMRAEWFREPTPEELPPGSGGVHIVDGRAYGWVAQRGVPHASHGRKVTIEKLAARGLDFSHFLRAAFRLDDGSEVRAGAMTMNVGHHRDGYECESAVCQFDDTRTVAAVVTVGMNEGGLWFSGAAAPWLSPWDRTVFQACQPSYHMTQGSDGRWQLRAVLSVPVPGHSSPLTAATVIDRSNLALTAAAAAIDEVTASEPPRAAAGEPEPEHGRARDEALTASTVDEVTAALLQPAFLDQFAQALQDREAERAAAARAELEELTARLAPLRAEIAATAAQQQEGN